MSDCTVIETPSPYVTVVASEGSKVRLTMLGLPGPAGAPGAGLNLLGARDTPADLPASANVGDAWLVAGDVWVFDGSSWRNGGSLRGPAGADGRDGQIRFTGQGTPPTVIVGAQPGDTYLDLDTGDVYTLQ